MSRAAWHRLLLSLGSNVDRERSIGYALAELRTRVHILRETEIMLTDPVDFPYPSGTFANVLLLCESSASLSEMQTLLHRLETDCGRTAETRRLHPELIHLDADLIIWEHQVLKPQDLARPYVRTALELFSFDVSPLSPELELSVL